MKDPVVSVVIPVQRDASSFGQCLEAVLRQDYPKKEVIIVCDPRADVEEALPAGSEDIRVIREREASVLAHLANDGMRAARGHVKILLVPECAPVGRGWMRRMAEPFRDETVGVVVSRYSPLRDSRPGLGTRLMASLPCRRVVHTREDRRKCDLVGHRCDAYRASLLADIGYFSENLPGPAEAVETSIRVADAGYSILHSEEAVVTCTAGNAGRLAHALRKAPDYGRSDALLDRQYGLRWLNSGLFGAAALALLLVPLAAVSLPVAFLFSGILFLWGWFLSLHLPLVRWELPVFVVNFALFVAAVLLIRDDWSPGLFGRRIHPALLRQWCWLGAVSGTYLLLLARAALLCAVRTLRQPRGVLYAVPVGLAAVAWWLVAGVGYLRGALLDSVSGR
jgi:GT2 family glycosyltransferase